MSATPHLTVVCRHVSPSMANCELTCIDRETIDVAKVKQQHGKYTELIGKGYAHCIRGDVAEMKKRVADADKNSSNNTTEKDDAGDAKKEEAEEEKGAAKSEKEDVKKEEAEEKGAAAVKLIELPALDAFQDAMFVEDVAIVFDECAVLTNPGAVSRQGEVDAMVDTLTKLRGPDRVFRVASPGTIEGGDTLVVGKFVFVGDSTRTNKAGFEQLANFVKPFGYQCFHIPISKCLHLKSAASMLNNTTVLVNKEWIDPAVFTKVGLSTVFVDHNAEPGSANVLSFTVSATQRVIFVAAAYPKSLEIIENWVSEQFMAQFEGDGGAEAETQHIALNVIEVDEVAKAEGALTCCSLLCYGGGVPAATKPEGAE